MLTQAKAHHYRRIARNRMRGRTSIAVFGAMFLLVASLIFLVWSRFQVTYLGYQISQAIHEQKLLLNHNKALKIEGTSLRSLSRIEGIATGQLGLTNPQPQQMVHLQ